MSGSPDLLHKRVLVVDDFALVRRVVKRRLEAIGFSVVGANSFDEATTLLEQEPFDILITDVYMPDGDGFEVLAHVRQHLPELKVVVMSGRFSMDSYGMSLMSSLMGLGANAVLMKPFHDDELLDAVDRALLTA